MLYIDYITIKKKTKIMASSPSPITSWQIDGETVEIVTDFIYLGSKITVDGDYSHETIDMNPGLLSCYQPRVWEKKKR